MATTKTGRMKKILKACETKHNRLLPGSKNEVGRKENIENLKKKIAARTSGKYKTTAKAEPVAEKKDTKKKGKK